MEDSQQKSSIFRKLFSQAGILFIAQIVNFSLYFVTQRFILSNFSKDENGVLFMIQRVGELAIFILVEAGMTDITLREVVQNQLNTDEILASLLKLRIILWSIVSGIMILVSMLIAPAYSVTLLIWFAYLLIAFKGTMIRAIFEIKLRVLNRIKIFALSGVLDSFFLLILVYFDRKNLTPERIIFWFFISSIPGFIAMVIACNPMKIITYRFSWKITRRIVEQSLPVTLAILLQQFHDKSDAFFLQYFYSMDEVGIYAAAYRILSPLQTIFAPIITVLTPFISGQIVSDKEQAKKTIFLCLKWILILFTGLIMLLTVSVKWIIEFATQGKYADNELQFAIFLWITLPMFVAIYSMFINVAIENQRKNFKITGILVIVSIVANIIFTPLLASVGAIIAKMLAYTIAAGYALYATQKFMQNTWISRFLLRYAVLLFLSCSASALMLKFLPPQISLLISLPLFAIFVWISKIIEKSEFVWAKKQIKSML